MKESVQTSWILQNGTRELFGCECASLLKTEDRSEGTSRFQVLEEVSVKKMMGQERGMRQAREIIPKVLESQRKMLNQWRWKKVDC